MLTVIKLRSKTVLFSNNNKLITNQPHLYNLDVNIFVVYFLPILNLSEVVKLFNINM